MNRADSASREGESDGMTPLLYACAYGAEECVEILVNNGAEVNAINSKGELPLDHADKNGDEHAIRVLEAAKANRSDPSKSFSDLLMLQQNAAHVG